MPNALLRRAQPRGPHDRSEVVYGRGKVLINNNIIELIAVAHFFACGVEPARDRRRVVLPAMHKARRERIERLTDVDIVLPAEEPAVLRGPANKSS